MSGKFHIIDKSTWERSVYFDYYYTRIKCKYNLNANLDITHLVTITTHERNINARNKCIQSKGTKCFVCGFDFEKTYGELGKGFIHIHHVTPISNRDGRYEIEVEKELFPVCPNCHAMLHRRKDSTLSIEELKLIIQQNND